MISQKQDSSYGRHYRGKSYELLCDQCGEVGVFEDTFNSCVEYAKDNKWKSKSVRTKDQYQRYIFSHYCPKCKD